MESQKRLMKKQADENARQDLKTTLVLLRIVNGYVQWGHVGDSRLYYFKNGRIVKRTLDHSVPQMLVAAGEIDEKEIRHHPDRNRLVRVMGMEWDEPKYQVSEPMPEESGQAFLLCSDGFWEQITEKEMMQCLKKADTVDMWLDRMVEIVNENGKGSDMDNNSAIAVWVEPENK